MKKLVVMLVMMTSLMSSAWAANSQVLEEKIDSIAENVIDSALLSGSANHLIDAIATAIENEGQTAQDPTTARMSALSEIIEDSLVPIAICCIMPLGIVISIFVYLHYRNRERTRLLQCAIEHNQDISAVLAAEQKQTAATTNDDVWRKGIRNVAIGAALTILLFTIGAGEIAAVGCFPLFLGIGQIVIAKTTKDPQQKEDELNTPIQNETEA